MVSMPKKPLNWGDDLEDVQINANPTGDAPITVTDPGAFMQAVPPFVQDPRGTAPSPADYARMGEMANQLMLNPSDPDGNSEASGMMYNLGQLLAFHRGGPLDAQVQYGGSTPYANYAFGVHNAGRGADLGDLPDLANLYGKMFSKYDPQKTKFDQTYTSIPAENVQNITSGYNDYKNGTLGRRP